MKLKTIIIIILISAGFQTFSQQYPKHHFLLVTISEDNNVKVENHFINDGNNQQAQQFDFFMPSSSDMVLQNITIQSGEEKTFVSQNTIEVAGNGTAFSVEQGGDAKLIASEGIVLNNGFCTEGVFYAYNQDLECENTDDDFGNNKPKKTGKSIDMPGFKTDNFIENRRASVCIFPNPSDNGIFSIYMNGSARNANKIEIFDVTGKNIYSAIQENKLYETIVINLSGQKAGIYFLKIDTKYKVYSKKLIINL